MIEIELSLPHVFSIRLTWWRDDPLLDDEEVIDGELPKDGIEPAPIPRPIYTDDLGIFNPDEPEVPVQTSQKGE